MATMLSFDIQNIFILVLLPCLFLFVFFFFFKKPNNGYHLPPSPPSLPIIGHLHLLLSPSIHKSLQKISSKYGPLLHLRVFNVPIFLVSSASVAYEIFKTHDVNVSSRGAAGVEESLVFGSSGFTKSPYGDYWKFMKKLLATKVLGSLALNRSRGVRAVELEQFYRKILDKAMKKESIGIIDESTRFINNSICKMSMGSVFSEKDDEAGKVLKLSLEFAALSGKIFLRQVFRTPLKKLRIALFKKEIMDVSNRIDELMERILVEHEKKMDEEHLGKDMMDTMLEAYRDENAEYKLSRDNIKSLFAELFLGATDSSSATIQWTLAEIFENPKVLERLRDEIDSVVGKTRLIQETDLPNLPYLHAIIKEVLRLHSNGPVLLREFHEGCKIGGFDIPAGTTLLINSYAVMRDPDNYEDPNEFKPERFLNIGKVDERREQLLKYLPFGGGRRSCPGENLAYMLVGIAIGVMVQCFDWEFEGERINMEESTGRLFLTMSHPLKCVPLPRSLNPLPSNLNSSSL